MSDLPHFIIIGAMKCGTTTLAAQLAAQNGIFMTTPKEPNFFSDDDVFARGEDWYRGLFATANAGDLRGEASTHYTKLPTYPQTLTRMSALVEAPRIIYMIRNPVERAVSHYLHEWSQNVMSGDPVVAFETFPELVDYGRYGMQIAPFMEEYGADAILLTSLEILMANPPEELSRIGAFLGREAVWDPDLKARNVSAERTRKFPLHGLLIDNPVATGLRRAFVPKWVRTRIRKARSVGKTRPELPVSLVSKIEATFLEDRAVLGRHFPAHPALDACYPFAS